MKYILYLQIFDIEKVLVLYIVSIGLCRGISCTRGKM